MTDPSTTKFPANPQSYNLKFGKNKMKIVEAETLKLDKHARKRPSIYGFVIKAVGIGVYSL